MELYRRRTREIVNLFLDDAITIAECRYALDATLADLTRRMVNKEYPVALRILMSANNEMILKEMARRKTRTSPSAHGTRSAGY